MDKKLILIIVLVVLIVIAGGAYYLIYSKPGQKNSDNVQNSIEQARRELAQIKVPSKEDQLAQIKKEYPETITGILNFFDTATTFKATIKTDTGKIYILWPAQPKDIYESFGVKEGQKVEVWGKTNSQGNFEWGNIKPI